MSSGNVPNWVLKKGITLHCLSVFDHNDLVALVCGFSISVGHMLYFVKARLNSHHAYGCGSLISQSFQLVHFSTLSSLLPEMARNVLAVSFPL